MSMSKKDFIALADAIKAHDYNAHAGAINVHAFTYDQISTLASFCRSQNSNFMRDRWIDYLNGKCGKNGGAVKGYTHNGKFYPADEYDLVAK